MPGVPRGDDAGRAGWNPARGVGAGVGQAAEAATEAAAAVSAFDWDGAKRRELRDARRPEWETLPATRAQRRYIEWLSGQVPALDAPPEPMTRGAASDHIARLRSHRAS